MAATVEVSVDTMDGMPPDGGKGDGGYIGGANSCASSCDFRLTMTSFCAKISPERYSVDFFASLTRLVMLVFPIVLLLLSNLIISLVK